MLRIVQSFRRMVVPSMLAGAVAASAAAQEIPAPVNSLPNPYHTIEGWAKMPEGRTWGSTSAVAVDRDGQSIWVAERCGTNSCVGSSLEVYPVAGLPDLTIRAGGRVAIVTQGPTPLDGEAAVRLDGDVVAELQALLANHGHAPFLKRRPDGNRLGRNVRSRHHNRGRRRHRVCFNRAHARSPCLLRGRRLRQLRATNTKIAGRQGRGIRCPNLNEAAF